MCESKKPDDHFKDKDSIVLNMCANAGNYSNVCSPICEGHLCRLQVRHTKNLQMLIKTLPRLSYF